MQFYDVLVCLVPLLVIASLPVLLERVRKSSRRQRQEADAARAAQQAITMGKAMDDATPFVDHSTQ